MPLWLGKLKFIAHDADSKVIRAALLAFNSLLRPALDYLAKLSESSVEATQLVTDIIEMSTFILGICADPFNNDEDTLMVAVKASESILFCCSYKPQRKVSMSIDLFLI